MNAANPVWFHVGSIVGILGVTALGIFDRVPGTEALFGILALAGVMGGTQVAMRYRNGPSSGSSGRPPPS